MSVVMRFAPLVVFFSLGAYARSQVEEIATYEVRFDATWSAETHPDAYPFGAHFSPLWIASHSPDVRFWAIGGVASDGIEQMAETGGTTILNNEFSVAQNAGEAFDRFLAPGINSPGTAIGRIDVTNEHPLVTVVTMVAPSPDWFVGVPSFNLWLGDTWENSAIVELLAFDAGTDSGTSFTSPNADTNPREPIGLLFAPFDTTFPLGTLTFTRRLPLPGDTNDDDMVNIDDLGNVRNNFGVKALPGEQVLGDTYPFDGVVDLGDLNAVRNNFGLPRGIVPEPTGVTLAAIAAFCTMAGFRQRRRNRIATH